MKLNPIKVFCWDWVIPEFFEICSSIHRLQTNFLQFKSTVKERFSRFMVKENIFSTIKCHDLLWPMMWLRGCYPEWTDQTGSIESSFVSVLVSTPILKTAIHSHQCNKLCTSDWLVQYAHLIGQTAWPVHRVVQPDNFPALVWLTPSLV